MEEGRFKMKNVIQYSYRRNHLSTMLGIFLFFQAATSLISGAFLFNQLVDDTDIIATMQNVANAMMI